MRAAKRADQFPPGIPFIVGNEGAERFSYYGMRAILYIYLFALYTEFANEADLPTAVSAAAGAQATAVTHLFMAGVYAFPMIGAIFADRLLGKYPVIFWVSIIYCAGHAVLAVAGRFAALESYRLAELLMYGGLLLIAIGAGGIKPCVSANMGDQFSSKNQHLVTKVFQIFYFIINFGSFFSTLLIPLLYRYYDAEVAFGVPGVLMALATIVFWLGRRRFIKVPPKPGGRLGGLDVLASVLLFSPVVALIAAVFVQGGHYDAGSPEGRGAVEFYVDYVTGYLGHLAASSWHYFVVAFAALAAGLVVFAARQRRKQDTGFLAVVVYAWLHRKERKAGEGFFDVARARFGDEAAEGPMAVFRIMLVFSMVSVFWALFDQHASTWIEQAKQMDRMLVVPGATFYAAVGGTVLLSLFGGVYIFAWVANQRVPRNITLATLCMVGAGLSAAVVSDMLTGWRLTLELEAAQISALNPLMVMIIIPALNALVYGPLESRGISVKPLTKMTVGMFLTAFAFAVAALLQGRVEAAAALGEQVPVLLQSGQYLVMTTAEVLVSVTGLEFAYTQAPRAMKSTMTGFWLLTVTFGNVLVAFLAPLQAMLTLSEFFWVFTGLMALAAMVFTLLASQYRGRTYLQSGAVDATPEPEVGAPGLSTRASNV